MITKIHFKNFKALEDFSVTIKDFNVLTGPNNSGKSTILDGVRVLQGAYRFASRLNPTFLRLPDETGVYGYEIPDSSIPIILENIQTDLNTDSPSIIKYSFSQGQSLTLFFQQDYQTYLYFDTPRKPPRTSSSFKAEFPVNISVIPTLGPFEISEDLVEAEYIQRWYGSRRSPRLFRSYWYHNLEKFDEFKKIVEETWKGMSISPPQRRGGLSKQLVMFCDEKRFPREVCWAGFGFQIWLQLLTHLLNAKNADILVVDEPEIYLHPDLQHKLLELLKNIDSKIILATHSVEIINSVETSEVLLVDKTNKSAKRISDLDELQRVSNLMGSGQNIQLTRLARGKRILFVEGKDLKLLTKLAKIIKNDEVFSSGEITVIPLEGFTQHERIIHTNWGFTQILGEELKIAVLLDRDYRCIEEVQIVMDKLTKEVSLVHILDKKEIENYFLVPSAIHRAIENKLKEKVNSGVLDKIPDFDTEEILKTLSENLKATTSAQLISHKLKMRKGKDESTIIAETSSKFESDWNDLNYRLSAVSGKALFSTLNDYLQSTFKVSITYQQLASYINEKELTSEIKTFFSKLETFRKGN
ncbi:MAG: AAA family ATPase [Pyrinomonadaceae bacterium]|nr:AAA family ATPase [Pyrinomonadaceae bacterium]